MPQLDSVKLEVNVGAGWVDITAYLDLSQGANTHIGRTSPYSAAPPGTLSLTLDNTDGRFTPGRQVLADGTTANPYWPNLLPRAQIRMSWVKGASTYRRFTGFVKGWPPSQQNGHARVQIEATTADDRLSRVTMRGAIEQEVLFDSPMFYWPLDEEAGSTTAAELVAGKALSINHVADAALTFGDAGPGSANGTGVKFDPSSATVGQTLRNTSLGQDYAGGIVAEAWVKSPSPPTQLGTVFALFNDAQTFGLRVYVTTSGHFIVDFDTGALTMDSGVVVDGGWHLITVTVVGTAVKLYADGVLADTNTWAGAPLANLTQVQVGGSDYSLGTVHDRFDGNIGHVAVYNSLSAAHIAAHFNAGRDWAGVGAETVDERIARFLLYGYGSGTIPAGTIDASDVVLGGYPQDGKDVITGCQDMAVTEGGGAVFYADVNGNARFHNRDYRTPGGAPDLTVGAETDLDGANYSPAFDDTQIVNQVAGTRGTISGTASTIVVDDLASQDQYGITSDSFTSYAADDDDVRRNAQDRLAQQADPAFRLEQLTVDLATSSSSTIYADVAGLDIGSRIQVTGLPPTAAPASTLDVYVEGWSETYSVDGVSITFDTSPADNPPQAVWDDATYGRFQANDDLTLQLGITASSTSLQIVSSASGSPIFTTNAAMYPLKVRIGEEHITLTGAPSGTNPQIFTGITRGVDSTPASAHAVAAHIDVFPTTTFAL